jgi:hypothetical protein
VRGVASEVSPSSGFRFVCYCKDCQAFAHFLERPGRAGVQKKIGAARAPRSIDKGAIITGLVGCMYPELGEFIQ